MLNDLRYVWRQLRKSPGFALTAVLTLALGIGATTSIFTLVYDAMLRPLPFAHADRLVTVQEKVLFGVSPCDPRIAAAALMVLVAAGAAACWLPARRAASVEPMEALRNE